MIFRRSARHGGAELDRLLDAGAGVPPTGADPVARLLSAAAAPARPDELAGEEAALAAFRAARVAPVRPAEPPRRRRPIRAGAVAWAAGIAVTATAGVAFAAATIDRPGLPIPPRPVTPAPLTSDSAPASPTRPGGDGTSGTPSGGPTSSGPGSTTGAPSAGTPTTGAPSPSSAGPSQRLAGHCKAYLAKSPAQREKALDKPAFADLVTAAGGRDRVTTYCTELVGEPAPPATGKPEPEPSAD
ncbi:hypothetical protein [Micromonospora sp. NPDC126480]|uniref:hypothetical protein n=1 Tax=Micromonospora sp. NPDC126480 TaxID=3155312 RepID=UPI00331A2495